MRPILSLALSVALVLSTFAGISSPVSAAGAAAGQINGVARTHSGQQLVGQLARLRSLDIGHIADVTTTSTSGRFSFDGLTAGSYVVELLSSSGFVVGTSAPVVLTARNMTADDVTALAPAQAQAGALAGSFWASTVGLITVAAVATAVIVTVVAVQDDESPTQ